MENIRDVYVTKYVLTTGLKKFKVYESDIDCNGVYIRKVLNPDLESPCDFTVSHNECFLNYYDAIERMKVIVSRKIEKLKNKITELEDTLSMTIIDSERF